MWQPNLVSHWSWIECCAAKQVEKWVATLNQKHLLLINRREAPFLRNSMQAYGRVPLDHVRPFLPLQHASYQSWSASEPTLS